MVGGAGAKVCMWIPVCVVCVSGQVLAGHVTSLPRTVLLPVRIKCDGLYCVSP